MKAQTILLLLLVAVFSGCQYYESETARRSSGPLPVESYAAETSTVAINRERNGELPTIGVIMFDNVLMTEVTAPIDVFSKSSEEGVQFFNVVTIAKTMEPVRCESGLRLLPDYTFESCPKLDVLVVPSAYNMAETVKDQSIVDFIKQQNTNSKFTVSNCGGAQLIGESGIADGKKIVTWIGGGTDLQKAYPSLLVQDDATVSYVEDGKFLSSNGNLASYISSLKLLEKMTSKQHRAFVESYLYLERLRDWKD